MSYANDMPEVTSARPATLAADLRVSVMRLARRIRQQRSADDISVGQYSVLGALVTHGPRTPRELADHERVQPPSMTRTINCLLEAGLVERTDHPLDGRQVLVTVTDHGARIIEETRKQRTAWLAQRLAELTPAERTTLAEAAQLLLRLADA
jgi:DNA-binding MarR family transcriptional regulator